MQKISGSDSCPFVLLRVDVERLTLDDGRTFDRLSRRAVDAADDDVDLITSDELGRLGGGHGVVGRAVLEQEDYGPPEQAALGVELVDHHPGHVRVREPDERQRARLIGDHSDLDRGDLG